MATPKFYLVTPLAYTGATTAFTYHSDDALAPGQIVEIPIGRRKLLGVVGTAVPKPNFATKPISRALDLPPVPIQLQELARWIAAYYASSPASVWSALLPAGLAKNRRAPKATVVGPAGAKSKAVEQASVGSDTGIAEERGGVRSRETALLAAPLPTATTPVVSLLPSAPPLTADQTAALAQIRRSPLATHLIQGVTGSGKTRLYLELAAVALAAGRSVLILVPEITLTPQIVSAFEAAFGPYVLTSHSKLTEAQRHRIWLEAVAAREAGQPRIVIGPRSCLFMPLHQLGLIVVDECHDASYKQDQHPRYHAVAVAAQLAKITAARLILGSATPSLNELYLAQQDRVEHIILANRINNIRQSKATIIDLRNKDLFKASKLITQPLIDTISATITAGRQTLLYLGRRGSASSQVCADCGQATLCPNCQLPLTFHADLLRLICHHCNYRAASAAVCPACGHANLRLIGAGTKRLEAEIAELFPQARIARLDRDSATLAHMNATLRALRNRELDIIIGTQMIVAGLDFPGLDTIGVISADTLLHLPDFSAAERTFQLLSQVSGRAGRGDRPGQIFIQTYTPDHPTIQAAASNDYSKFAETELTQRQTLRYPPFVYLLKLTVTATTRDQAVAEATKLATQLKTHPSLDVAGPAPAFIETAGGRYHWLVTVKSTRRPPLVEIANNLPGSHWTADLDPTNLL